MDGYSWWTTLAGLAGAGLFLLVAGIAMLWNRKATVGTRHKLLVLIEGADGRLSTSKFQWFAWTAVIVGSYVAVYVARVLTGHTAASPQVPANVLIALGFSTTTMATAKGITTLYIAGGRTLKEPPPTAANSANAEMRGGLLADDTGITDLSKVQLVTWTLIALAVYIYSVQSRISAIPHSCTGSCSPDSLPDIDTVLMVLTGLAQGGYLGKKLVDSSRQNVTLNSLVPDTANPGGTVHVYGSNFGDPPAGVRVPDDSYVTIDGSNVPGEQILLWKSDRIDVKVGANDPRGAAWSPDKQYPVGVVVEGAPSSSKLSLTVVPPP
ncbi:MAG TPA: hypothetical protein VLW53_24230 [Candidatus Eisenbacteria bacterium]|nr:hypothetical protein [Candidatus Eisenbacteria bacterium]